MRHEAAGKADDLKIKFGELCESTNGEIAALEKAETDLWGLKEKGIWQKRFLFFSLLSFFKILVLLAFINNIF